jgi:CheY-like chemotaxis protein
LIVRSILVAFVTHSKRPQALRSKGKVLVIDDDPIVLELTRERLEGAGYEVLVRENALGTLQLVRDEQPDVVLLDVMMPALNGERIASLLKSSERTKETKIILFSSKSEEELQAMTEQAGAIGAISKHERPDSFVQRFERLLRKRSVDPRLL